MRDVIIPAEFAELDGKVFYIQRKNNSEYSSSCPQCGGSVHADGELPDRFIMLMPSISKAGIPYGWCRRCGYKWYPGKDGSKAIDPETIKRLQEQAKEAEDKYQEARRVKLAEFTTQELWEELHMRMGEEQKSWWRKAGVPDEWQNYLQLGYIENKTYRTKTGLRNSPSYTIPYFDEGFIFRTMQYRLCNPEAPADRYRFEAGLGTFYYLTTPSLPIADEVIVCEGAKKAMVVRIYGEKDNKRTTVLAVPSKMDWRSCGIIEAIKNCGRIYIVFDPDCYIAPANTTEKWVSQPVQFAQILGSNSRLIELPVKIDDAFINYGMEESEWKELKKISVRI